MSNPWDPCRRGLISPASFPPPLSRSFGVGCRVGSRCRFISREDSEPSSESVDIPNVHAKPTPDGRQWTGSLDEDALNCSCTFLHSVNCTAQDGGGGGGVERQHRGEDGEKED